MQEIIIKIAYLIASILFITGIKLLGKTPTAQRGNQLSMLAMFIAIVATLVQVDILNFTEIIICIVVGSAIGLYAARKVDMTQMPEMVALFNGFGGLASLAVAMSDYWLKAMEQGEAMGAVNIVSVILSVFIGGVTFTGSYVAFGKLSGTMKGGSVTFKGQHALNLILILFVVASGAMLTADTFNATLMWVILGVSLLLGFLLVIPIGGADMPVVISLLNSYSGVAACTTGFILNNEVLIIAGALVGASGIILTQIMCKAMNRSLLNVLMGGFGQTASSGPAGAGVSDIVVKEVGVEETAMIFDAAQSVIIVPGYGMAVAQAQHVVRELMDLLEKKGISVRFAIHPVAGRMPGHMNVLLAESNVPYEKLVEMDDINDDFANCDVCLVIGANDVVNPAARSNPQSPIFGMPILNADKSKTVIVSKRSMAAGYAGIENELFGFDNCLMLFGDAKATLTKVVSELKAS
jgi:NAD(P) transhydrogenase subunit beta